ncbi:MAG: sigma-70 family RNA polymerase sigma factor [Phycisphaerales bacterium]
MTSAAPNKNLTTALNAYAAGERQGSEELMRLVYARLRAIAEEQLRSEGPGHTLQPTALVNEAFLRLAGQHTEWRGRSHFYAIAAQAMRRVLIDHARARDSEKRGGGRRPVALSEIDPAAPQSEVDLLALDEALERLASVDAETARVVEMRFFGGMEMDAIVEVTGIPERTIRRHWVYAKAWLARELGLQADAPRSRTGGEGGR